MGETNRIKTTNQCREAFKNIYSALLLLILLGYTPS